MSATREFVFGVLAGLFDFGPITGTKRGTRNKTIALDFEGNVDQEDRAETESADVWGCSAMQYRPADPTSEGAAEVLFIRRSGELLPIATRDFRFQVDLEKGEVVVTNNDKAKPARIWLRADGTLTIEADEVRIGDAAASSTIALGDAVKNHFDSIKTWLDNHRHGFAWAGAAGANFTSVPYTGVPTPAHPSPAIDPSPSVPDVESRHKVEN